MIYLQLFLEFLKIGIFTFGGGYAMVALIQDVVVRQHGWMTLQEFADILAVSQMTPGPIGINTATYVGYTAVLNDGGSYLTAVAGAMLASLAVILLPVTLMLIVYRYLLRYQNRPVVSMVLKMVKLSVVGLIASAALSLLTHETFGSDIRQIIISSSICLAVFLICIWPKKESPRLKRPGPIALIILSGLLGLLLL